MGKIINPLRVNGSTGVITIMTRAFAEQAFRYGTPEYKMLQEVRNDFPDHRVVVRKIRTNPAQKRYCNLTYDRMREYIEVHDPASLAEYDKKCELAEFHTKATRYPKTKKWFLEHYPEIKTLWVDAPAEAEGGDQENIVPTDGPVPTENVTPLNSTGEEDALPLEKAG